eukprot:7383387-Prymnesium_polylepis.1
MSETFDGPGEDSLTVMTYDRSIETESELYRALVPYALIMLLIYPIGTPLQVASNKAMTQTASADVACVAERPSSELTMSPKAQRALGTAHASRLQYAVLLYRNRNQLNQLRLIEMTIEADLALARLDAEAVTSEMEAAE